MLVAALLEATARILAADGWAALTTNRVARQAGVSVGSLYQYFPNKEALVAGLIERWVDETGERLVEQARSLAELPVERCVHHIVQSALAASREGEPLFRSVLAQLPPTGALEPFERLNRRLADALADWIAHRRSELEVEDPSLAAYVLVTALDGAIDHALLFRPELLDSQRFARQLEHLVAGCLGMRSPNDIGLPGAKEGWLRSRRTRLLGRTGDGSGSANT